MSPSPIIVLRLTGALLTCGEDWSLREFGKLFARLENEIDSSRSLRRYLRYFGETGETTELRFFGTAVDSIKTIPEGMVSLELSEEEFTVYQPENGHPSVLWQSSLTWDWLDRSNPEFPTGEFVVNVPKDWLSVKSGSQVRFILSANSYSQQGIIPDDDVHLVEYNPSLPDRFEEMADWLRNAISPNVVLRIEHYGSTAIPGIPAKPVIDILVEVPSFSEARRNLIPCSTSRSTNTGGTTNTWSLSSVMVQQDCGLTISTWHRKDTGSGRDLPSEITCVLTPKRHKSMLILNTDLPNLTATTVKHIPT